jgi:sensor histidine kinase YesM
MLMIFIGIAVAQGYVMCSGCNSFESYFVVMAFTFLMWVTLWEGNNYLAHYLDRRISWIHEPAKRFIVGSISTVAFTFAVVHLLIWVFRTFLNLNFGNSLQLTIFIAITFTIVVTLFLHSRTFLFHWRTSVVAAEKFQRESITSRYESLKNRVNPQLLFTSLQTLGALIHADKENAVKFIKRLSEVYRYILDSREKNVVDGEDELKFLQSFFFLLKQRFGNAIELDLFAERTDFLVAPLSVQIIVESLIDNAEFQEGDPIHIKVSFSSSVSIVSGGIRWIAGENKERVRAAVKNIAERYTLLSGIPVMVEVDDNRFRCEIPFISPEMPLSSSKMETKAL